MDFALVPFRQFVLKMHSRCDLACDHCYIYEHADTQWRGRPQGTPLEVLAQSSERIAEHASTHQLSTVHVVLHGGEPLLAKPAGIRAAAELIRAALPDECALDLRIHTNGVLLDREFCDLFVEHDIKVGISLDGDKAANDLHRRYANGRSSHSKVLKAVALLQEPAYRHLFAGLLCTIDVRNDPIAVYDALMALDPPRLDFLLPHATWEHPPLRPDGPGSTPYADWLGAVHQRWEAQGRPVPVRTFDSVLRTLQGLSSLTENLGLEPADLVVIETDGTLEQADSLRTTFDGAAATGFNVFDHDFDQAAGYPGMIDRQLGLASLSATCQACPVVTSCGGGLYAHRYSEDRKFDNPSVFCEDLFALISGIAEQESAVNRSTAWQLDELATGYGGTKAVTELVADELEISRGLLLRVWRQVEERTTSGAPDAHGAKGAWTLLTALDEEVPDALDRVLAHPYSRAWAVRCLGGGSGIPADPGGLAEIAAATVLQARLPGRPVDVPVRAGVLRLPGVGRVLLGGRSGTASVAATEDGFSVEADGDLVRVRWDGDGLADPRWQPLRRVAAGTEWTVALEDTDPQRDSHQYPVADRLSDAEFEAWSRSLEEAWRLVTRALPGYAEGVAAGLTTITPLRPSDRGRDISAAARAAFGAVGIARPAGSDTLALLIVHEFQHVKLGAVLDRHVLFDTEDTTLYYAPWRHDPRPLEGLFQGTYAHVGVTEYWRSRWRDLREEGGPAAEHAELEFARWRAHTADAVETLAGSGSLTPLGQRFAGGMRATVAPWLDEPVGRAADIAAQRSMEATRASWLASRGAGTGVGG